LSAMKRLLLFAAIIAASAGNLSGSPDQSPPAHKQEVAQQSPANTSPVTVVIENAQCSEPASSPTPKTPEGNTSAEWVLVIVGLITCGVIGWQSWETRRAAKAALLNAQALINAERPWIVMTAKRTGTENTDEFMIYGEVQGRSPAKIISGWGDHITIPQVQGYKASSDGLPDEPPYNSETALTYEMLAVPGQTPFLVYAFRVSHISSDVELWRRIGAFEEVLFLFGRLIYTDILTKDSNGKPTEHETRWCFQYTPSKPEGMVTKAGKPAYNRYT